MKNDNGNAAENAELRDRVARIEALVSLIGERVALHHNHVAEPHPRLPDLDRKLSGEIEAIRNGFPLTSVWKDETQFAEPDGNVWTAGCPCNWAVHVMTEQEAVTQAIYHEREVHRLEFNPWADLLGAGPDIHRTEDRAEGEAA